MNQLTKRQKYIIKETISYAIIIVLAVVIALLINRFLIVNARVPTSSMVPTINKLDRIIGNRLAYINKAPERGDIIIFPFPDNEKEIYVKRIIGLPGETVEIRGGVVYINGSPLDESSYLTVETLGDWGPYYVPLDSYFVLGDNRNNSKDSRYWDNKFVSRDKIMAKALFKYYRGFEIFD